MYDDNNSNDYEDMDGYSDINFEEDRISDDDDNTYDGRGGIFDDEEKLADDPDKELFADYSNDDEVVEDEPAGENDDDIK